MKLAHHVYFQLKDNSEPEIKRLIAIAKKYLTVQPGIVSFEVGEICRELNREVNDQAFDVALQLVFTDKAAHDAYQDDATHNKFIDEGKSNWKNVRVFDWYVA